MENSRFRLLAVSESAVLAYSKQGNIEQRNRICQHIATRVLDPANRPEWLLDAVPSYDSIMLHYDCLQVDHHEVFDLILNLKIDDKAAETLNTLVLPVCYSLPRENDLEDVALHTGLSVQEIIRSHSESVYSVYAIGFAPGFAYMGFVPDVLQTPRRASPRTKVPKGAVALADKQTAVYPSASPGGWNILGYCPLNLVDINSVPISPFQVGQEVRFTQISAEQFVQYEDKGWQQWCDRNE